MPALSTLRRETVWGAQTVPDNLNNLFIKPLRKFYKMTAASIGAPGDENHLYGRHRSYNWCRGSRYCVDRDYGTTDGRDQDGGRDWYRAVDIGITGQTLRDACKRLDKAVRAGQLPGLAEWFGTTNGKTVTGWYQGKKSSSDSSHLWHLHVGFWNGAADDADTLRTLYAVITGTGDVTATKDEVTSEEDEDDMDPQVLHDLVYTVLGTAQGDLEIVIPHMEGGAPERRIPNKVAQAVAAQATSITALAAAVAAVGTNSPEVAGMLDAVQIALDAQTAALQASTSETVAALGEGGAVEVRRHASDS